MQDLDPGFPVDLLFPDEYSDFIAEIYYEDRLVFVISQELGLENAEVEFDTGVRGFPEKMSLDGFELAIAYAKRRLFDLRKIRITMASESQGPDRFFGLRIRLSRDVAELLWTFVWIG